MKILWIINVKLPDVSRILNQTITPYGGWLVETSSELAKIKDIDLTILYPDVKIHQHKIGNIKYQSFIKGAYSNKDIISAKKLMNEISPKFIHIFGTELPHSNFYASVANLLQIKVIVSIQGLVSAIEKHMYASLPFHVVYGFTMKNIANRDSVYLHRKTFIKRGKLEIDTIKKSQYIIGRTTWDKAATKQINSHAKYFHCNESLRREFYFSEKWGYISCEKNSIFISQGHYSLKGFHYVIEAIRILKYQYNYSDLNVYVSGKNIFNRDSIKSRIRSTYYGNYLYKKAKKYDLLDNIHFVGILDVNNMIEYYLKANAYVCASSIENSPNSLGEAMILGVPCIASYVGGIPDLIEHNKEGYLYQSDAPYMLAYYLDLVFQSKGDICSMTSNAILKSEKTHSITKIIEDLYSLYKDN